MDHCPDQPGALHIGKLGVELAAKTVVRAAAGSNYDLELPIGNGPTNRACGIDVASLRHKRTGNAVFDIEASNQRTAGQQINLHRAPLVGHTHEMTGIDLRGRSGCGCPCGSGRWGGRSCQDRR